MSVQCKVCGRELTDPNSVNRGIGPICLKALEKIDATTPRYAEEAKTELPSNIIVEGRFRKELGDLLPLIKSISKIGLLHPIIITKKKRLVAGLRRLEAWKALYEDAPMPVNIISEYLVDAEIEENTVRQDFLASEMAAIYEYFKPQIQLDAKGRQGARTDLDSNIVEIFHNVGKTRDIIAKKIGVSGRTLEKVVKIATAAKEEPERFEKLLNKVDEGKTSINYAYDVVSRAERHDNPPPLPEGKYDVIYADPP